jgi:hypothetical protein
MDQEQLVETEDDEGFDDVEGEAPPVDEYRLTAS